MEGIEAKKEKGTGELFLIKPGMNDLSAAVCVCRWQKKSEVFNLT